MCTATVPRAEAVESAAVFPDVASPVVCYMIYVTAASSGSDYRYIKMLSIFVSRRLYLVKNLETRESY